ncbi:MAG: DUF3991 and TOPRIM domain-containing protein [Kiritimatiellae bacterium]|nr:DUF3991 and TOPRIM domain-containing protein [Kiritimatiellia bacterium]
MSGSAPAQRTDRLRAIPLAPILRALDARPDPRDPAKWHTARGPLSVKDAKFFNWKTGAGGGGAIDLAMHLNGLSFKEAIEWLAQRFVLPPPVAAAAGANAPGSLLLPAPAAETLPTVLRYLCLQRRLPTQRLQPLLNSGDLYADRKHNAVFLLRGPYNVPVGAELRATGPLSWRGMAPGSRKNGGYFAVGPLSPTAVVLCESAIDAISCCCLDPQRLCLSTAGARANPAWLPALLARHLPIYCGFDNDATGERMAQAMLALYPAIRRLRPDLHDWNDVLRSRP